MKSYLLSSSQSKMKLLFNVLYPSLAFRGFCRASKYPHPLLIAAKSGLYIASIWEGNPAHDNGSVNPRLYNDYHMALKCAFQKFLSYNEKIHYKRDLKKIMNGTGHYSVFSTWPTMEIFAKAKADIMCNIASNSESYG